MTDNSEVKLPSGQVLRWREDMYPSYYSNLMALGMSAFDVTVQFGEIGHATTQEVVGIPKIKIVLSPEQAANLSSMLALMVERFVMSNGPLRTSGGFDKSAFLAALDANTVKGSDEG